MEIQHNKIYWWAISVNVNVKMKEQEVFETRIPVKAYKTDNYSGKTTIKYMSPDDGDIILREVPNSELFNSPK